MNYQTPVNLRKRKYIDDDYQMQSESPTLNKRLRRMVDSGENTVEKTNSGEYTVEKDNSVENTVEKDNSGENAAKK